jgi:hypothetical protein
LIIFEDTNIIKSFRSFFSMAKIEYSVAMMQEYHGEVESIRGNKVRVNFEVNGESEVREYSLRKLERGIGRPLQEGDAVRVYSELQVIEPRPPMTPKEFEAWKKKHAWMERLQKRVKRDKPLILEN